MSTPRTSCRATRKSCCAGTTETKAAGRAAHSRLPAAFSLQSGLFRSNDVTYLCLYKPFRPCYDKLYHGKGGCAMPDKKAQSKSRPTKKHGMTTLWRINTRRASSLRGTEVKSIRQGQINLKDSYCTFKDGELFVRGMHILPLRKGQHLQQGPVARCASCSCTSAKSQTCLAKPNRMATR